MSRRKTPDQHDHAPLSSAIGEFWSTHQVMARSGSNRDRLGELIEAHELLHVTTADDQRLFPAFQFDGKTVNPRLMQPMPELGGKTPLDVVERGSDSDRKKLLKILSA
ncbi:MAG: hypothetical protein ACTHYY_01550 [Agrococcus casei]